MTTIDGLNPTKAQLALDAGPYLLGTGVNWALLGCLSVQWLLDLYSLSNARDTRALKALVYTVYFVDIVQTAISTYCAWVQLIFKPYGYGDVLDDNWSNTTLSLYAGTVSFTVQCFFAWRIWVLQNTPIMRKLVICIVILAVVQCGAALVVTGQFTARKVPEQDQWVEPAIIWLIASLLCDILISGCLSHFLRKARSQTPFLATQKLLTKLLILTVQSGLITAVVAGLELASFIIAIFLVSNYWDHGFTIVLGKLYSNTLLASLNARTVVTRISDNQTDFGAEMRSDQGIAFRVTFAEITAQAGGTTVTTETQCGTPAPSKGHDSEVSAGV
ncbi:hypothetical protein PLICRDRAFT_176753 [Plicaturopsis crispa FD-325 SS-3]|nr:hypothetical protein PLICRDRAFT_176753 [Plicaturopsis crispa FD-325 SS-3]